MKLYTEEQLRQAYIDGMDFIAVDPTMYEQDANEYMRDVHSIELPSNDEIEKWANNKYHEVEDSRWFEPLQVGARWMRDKLTQIEMTKQDITREQKLEYIAKLLAKAMYYGDWKWQTPNERVIELLMTDIGLYGFSSEDNMIAETGVPEELYTIARNEIHTRREYVKHSVICYHGGKYTYDPDFFECHKCGGIVEEQYRIKQ